MAWSTVFAGIGLGLQIAGGISGASAARKSARAEISALESEKKWNLDVMRQNIEDVRETSLLQSWGAGINPLTGSTAAVIENNENVMRKELAFREGQYNKQIANLRAMSKQRYLGLF